MDPRTDRMPDLPSLVLAFGASDPSGGAGLQADVLTLASMGCHPLTVVTALTVQDTAGVEAVHAVDPELVLEQARCLLEDVSIDAFKIGILGSVENISAIAEIVSDYPEVPLVFDPVLLGGRGEELASEEMIAALREMLVPQTTILTPSSMAARRLAADADDENEGEGDDLGACARRLIEMGAEYVLVTGAHEATPQVVNILHGATGIVRRDGWKRLAGPFHGAGCTLAAAIAATLANGLDVPEAVAEAQDYTWHALEAAFRPGMGKHLPDRLFWARDPGRAPLAGAADRGH